MAQKKSLNRIYRIVHMIQPLITFAIVCAALLLLFFIVNRNSQHKKSTMEMMEDYASYANNRRKSTKPDIMSEDPLAPRNSNYTVKAAEPIGNNETYKMIDSKMEDPANSFGLNGNQFPTDCFPKDQLNPAELLPGDANSTWAKVAPNGQGELGDQNFLSAGFHVGINTIGSSLRNPNLQLRSEPPNPQVAVGPWSQSTINPDLNRKPLEIGN